MTDKNAYMLIFRGNEWQKGMSPEDLQEISSQWMAWFKRLTEQGLAVAGNPLEPKGKIVSGADRKVVDGPFAESKEAIGGYFLLKVDSMDEAVAIAKECPGLPYGAKVEVRQVMDHCPVSGQAVPEIELAEATS